MEKKNSKLAWIIGYDTPYHNIKAIDNSLCEISQNMDKILATQPTYEIICQHAKDSLEKIMNQVGGTFASYSISHGYLQDNSDILSDIYTIMKEYYGAETHNMKILLNYLEQENKSVEK